MERFSVGDAAAFQMLVTSSQDTNLKLVDVATWLTAEAEQRQHDAARQNVTHDGLGGDHRDR